MAKISPSLFIFLLFFGCNKGEDKQDNCRQMSLALDESSFHLRHYEEMVYTKLLYEVDSNQIEKLRVPALRKLFNLKYNAVRDLKEVDDEKQLSEIYQRFVSHSVKLVPQAKKDKLIQYSESLFRVQSEECYNTSFVQLAIYLTFEEAISLNLEDVDA